MFVCVCVCREREIGQEEIKNCVRVRVYVYVCTCQNCTKDFGVHFCRIRSKQNLGKLEQFGDLNISSLISSVSGAYVRIYVCVCVID